MRTRLLNTRLLDMMCSQIEGGYAIALLYSIACYLTYVKIIKLKGQTC